MKTIGIVGLGLIGGSFARAYKASDSDFTVYAADKDIPSLGFAQLMGAVDAELTPETLAKCDCVLVCLHTALSCAWLAAGGSSAGPGARDPPCGRRARWRPKALSLPIMI